MPACCSTFERAADQQFTEKKAAAELKRYRTKGPGPTTRLLQDGLAAAGGLNGTLLDIGSGVGALTFGLLERGIAHASRSMHRRRTPASHGKRLNVLAGQARCSSSTVTS